MAYSKEMQTAISKASELPALSNAALVLLNVLDSPNTTRDQIIYLIEIDEVLCANAYKYANSAFFSPRRKIELISEIVDYLGFNALKQIAITVAAKSIYNNSDMWFDSVFLAYTSRSIAKLTNEDREFCDRVYMMGLLQSMGSIILQYFYPTRYNKLSHETSFWRKLRLEKQEFGFNHLELTAAVLKDWGLPSNITKLLEKQDNYEAFHKENAILEIARRIRKIGLKGNIEIQNYLHKNQNNLNKIMKDFGLKASIHESFKASYIRELYCKAVSLC